jgi:phenylacetate-coenzyme A ligase PaaK-like adenylate-forming protein
MAAIHGRQDDVFEYDDGRRIHPHTFRSVLSGHAGIAEYQVRQTVRGARVIIVGSDALDIHVVERELVDALSRAGLLRPDVQIERAGSIERHAQSQKLKRFVPLV